MKIHFLIVMALFGVMINYSCSKETAQQEEITADTTTLSTSLKGWELYSWSVENEWCYSLLYGTNRAKTIEEVQFIISNPTQVAKVTSLENLEKILSKLSPSENIIWYTCFSGSSAIQLPPATITDALKTFCTGKKLNLQIIACH